MKIVRYAPEYKDIWDNVVEESRNGTFLLKRDYMDYHKHRFQDCSLMFFSEKGKCAACLPANIREQEKVVEAHGGLTYGGLVCTREVTAKCAGQIVEMLSDFYRELGAKRLIYKPTPYIYHTYPCEEDLYALFQAGASLTNRAVSSAIDLTCPEPFSTLRKRKAKKAFKDNLIFRVHSSEDDAKDLKAFWEILTDVLLKRHRTLPVHSYDEINLLQQRFKKEIRLFTVHSAQEEMLGGCLIYLTTTAAHVQYIAATDEGCASGALDLLFSQIINGHLIRQRYLDFGISTEKNGTFLNEGLIFQKEGFGGRGVCYDTYTIEL